MVSQPTSRWLFRLLFFLMTTALLTIVAGNLVTHYTPRFDLVGRWMILSAIGVGLVATLLYQLLLFVRCLHISLLLLLTLVAMHGATVLVVSQSILWMSHSELPLSHLPALSPGMFLLSLATLALLMNFGAWALRMAYELPAPLTDIAVIHRPGRVVLRDEKRMPRFFVFVLYLIVPLAFCGGLWLSQSPCVIQSSPWVAATLLLVLIILMAIVALGIWTIGLIFRSGGESMRMDPVLRARQARPSQPLAGVPLSFALSIYIFGFAGTRAQSESLSKIAAAERVQHLVELCRLQPPPVHKDQNAFELYQRAEAGRPAFRREIFESDWDSPDAAMALRNCRPSLALVRSAAEREDCAVSSSYADTIDQRAPSIDLQTAGSFQALQTRLDALDGRWPKALSETNIGLRAALHEHHLPWFQCNWMGDDIEKTCIMGLFAALLWTPENRPDDNVLSIAQAMLREREAARGNPLARALRLERLKELLRHANQCDFKCVNWPGDVDVFSLARNQPFVRLGGRHLYDRYMSELADSTEKDPWPSSALNSEIRAAQSTIYNSGLYCIPIYYVEHDREVLCHYRLTEAALAVTRFKRLYGHWPESLQDCVPLFMPRVPSNPFNPDDCVRFAANPPRVFNPRGDGLSEPASHRRFDTTGASLIPSIENYNGDQVLYLSAIHPSMALAAAMQTAPGSDDIPDELALLSSKNDSDWRPAFRDLAHQGPRASATVPILVPILNDPIPERRMWAAYILGRIGRTAREANPTLEKLRESDPDLDVRRFAKMALFDTR